MRRGLVIALALAVALAVLAAPGAAHKKTFAVTTTFNVVPQPPTGPVPTAIYTGKILGPNPACVRARTVFVVSADGAVYARAVTDAAGNWATPPSPAGAVNALPQPKRLLKNKKHKHICRN